MDGKSTNQVMKTTTPASKQQPCPSCGGSGQISYFRGVSRFVMSWEECPECIGTGYVTTLPVKPADKKKTPDV